MIRLICGAKGSGKTKRIISRANESVATAKGDIVFITDTDRYMFDIKYQVRVVNTEEHNIRTLESLIGFIKGLIAGNHDIRQIYIDGAHRITRMDVRDMEEFYREVEKISDLHGIDFEICVSVNPGEAPEFLRKYL